MTGAEIVPGLIAAIEALERSRARRKLHHDPLYPRLQVWGSEWVRQDYAGGPWTVIPTTQAAELLGIEAAA